MLTERLLEYAHACFTGIWIQSHEHHDALLEMAQLCQREQFTLARWDIENGLSVAGQEVDHAGSDPLSAIRTLNALASPDGVAILVLQNFHRFLQSVEIVQSLARQILHGKQNRTIVVILAPVVQIPVELEKLFVIIEHGMPNRDTLAEIARGLATEEGELPRLRSRHCC